VLVWVVYRQFVGRFVSVRRLAVLPLVLLVFGVNQLIHTPLDWTTAAVVVVVVDIAITAALGIVRGYAIRLSTVDGYLFQRGGVPSLVLWLISIGARIGIAVVVAGTPAEAAVSTMLLVSFAISLAAQFGVLFVRVRADGRPLRPAGDRRASSGRSTLGR
jgi:hypothetical protein